MKLRDQNQKAREEWYLKNLEELQEKNRLEVSKLNEEMSKRCAQFRADLENKDADHAAATLTLNQRHAS